MGAKLNLVGRRFNRLVVIAEHPERSRGGLVRWLCACDCGGTKIALGAQLAHGKCGSCGCLELENRVSNCTKRAHELVGMRYGRLLVISRNAAQELNKHGKTMWDCLCDCGETSVVSGAALHGGSIRSCGCLTVESTRRRFTTHGATRGGRSTHEYSVNRALIRRCRERDHKDFPYYGGRGIGFDPRWEDHAEFLRDMGQAPSLHHTIERRDRDGDYCAANCYWADRKVQANNTSRNRIIEIDGDRRTLAQWCEFFGVPYSRARNRLYKGAPVSEVFSTLDFRKKGAA